MSGLERVESFVLDFVSLVMAYTELIFGVTNYAGYKEGEIMKDLETTSNFLPRNPSHSLMTRLEKEQQDLHLHLFEDIGCTA